MDAARLQLGGTPIALADGKRSVPSTPDVHEGLGAREDTGSSAGGAVGLCPALLHGAVAPGGSSPFRRIRNQRKRAMTVVRSGGLIVAAFGLAFYMWAPGFGDREVLSNVSDHLVEPTGGGTALS